MTEAARREHRDIIGSLIVVPTGACWCCGGEGSIYIANRSGSGRTYPEDCPRCAGTGRPKPLRVPLQPPYGLERRPRHGTPSEYAYRKCRCLECRKAFAVYRRGLKEAKR